MDKDLDNRLAKQINMLANYTNVPPEKKELLEKDKCQHQQKFNSEHYHFFF